MKGRIALVLSVLTFCSAVSAIDWYSTYLHNDGSLIAHFNMDGTEHDQISRRTLNLHGTTKVPGWIPQQRFVFDQQGKLTVPDVVDCVERRDFTISFRAKVMGGGGYIVLKKGSFGFNASDGKMKVYLRSGGKDVSIAGPAFDSGWHLWSLSVQGTQVTLYKDGIMAAQKTFEILNNRKADSAKDSLA